MLQAHLLTHHIGSRTLFSDLNLQVGRGARLALVGENGVGKTTLLRILASELRAEGGQVLCEGDETIGYLPQETPRAESGTVLQRVMAAQAELVGLGDQLASLEAELTGCTDGTRAMELAGRYAELQARFTILDGATLEARARDILSGLGFLEKRQEALLASLSGGWGMRVELARLLLCQPTYLLLDEPTNHLDWASLAFFEKFLSRYPGAAVVVSHDRYFLNRVVTEVAELSATGLLRLPGNYDAYVAARAVLVEQAAHSEVIRRKRLKEAQTFIERFGAKASKASLVQSRIKAVARAGLEQEGAAVVAPPRSAVHLRWPACPRSGRVVATCRAVAKAYGANVLYNDFSLSLERGHRLALMGPNGAGKSTLLRLLSGHIAPDHGEVALGSQVLPYFFAQHQLDIFDPKRSVLEEATARLPQLSVGQVRNTLGAMGLRGDSVEKRVGVLSGGEKSRLALACMVAQPCNLLLLDEPTNHLDLDSRTVLEEALRDFAGTIVFVSHDRYFINRLATHILEVRGGGATEMFLGDYEAFAARLAQRAADNNAKADAPTGPTAVNGADVPARQMPSTGRRARAAQRATAQAARRAAALEGEIAALEAAITNFDQEMCAGSLERAAWEALSQARSVAAAQLEAKMEAWEAASMT